MNDKDDRPDILEMISPINQERREELSEVINHAITGIHMARHVKGETITRGAVVVEVMGVACGHEIVVEEGTTTRVVIKNPVEKVRSDLFDYVAKLTLENV